VSSMSPGGLSGEEQAVYDELMAAAEAEPAKKSSALPYTPVDAPQITAAPQQSTPQPRTPQREQG
jgi:hypothetical protein